MSDKNALAVPVAIVIAGALIAGAVYYRGNNPIAPGAAQPSNQNLAKTLPAPNAKDHIQGNLNAPVIIMEYSDLECPFCKRFHETMNQVMATYGKTNQVAWIYRNFPLDQLHPKARHEAEAAECAAELGGNVGFWKYIDKVFEVTPSNNGLDPAQLPIIAGQIGLNQKAFETCLASGRYAKKIETEISEAVAGGGEGTPFPIVISKGDKRVTLPGAVPFDQLKPIIDGILKDSK